MSEMVKRKGWNEFRDTGLMFLVNTLLHTFGWALVFEMDQDGVILNVYPARVKFRGFSETVTSDAYKAISRYIFKESAILLDEALED